MVARAVVLYATIFKRVLDIIRVKIRHLKDESKWESSRRLDSDGLDIGGLKTTN